MASGHPCGDNRRRLTTPETDLESTFIPLGLAIIAAWLPPFFVNGVAVPPWTTLFGLAVWVGVRGGVLEPVALVALALLCVFAAAAYFAPRGRGVVPALAAAALALALALHLVPGFHAPKLFDGVRFSEDSLPFTSTLNFDKAAAGLLLLVAFCRPGEGAGARRTLAWTLGGAVVTPIVAIGAAVLAGFTSLDPKWPEGAGVFLAANLLFTCVAEEAFFRGLIQERIARLAERTGQPIWRWVAIAVASALFGLAHAGGGPLYMLLAGIAGLGYGVVYAATRRIESAILVHFALNAVHFTGFAYPALAH